jgi:putative transcriptional regulator
MINHIKQARMEKQLTQSELAALVQVSRQTIHSIESSRYVPSTVLALKLTQQLGRTVEELFQLEAADG